MKTSVLATPAVSVMPELVGICFGCKEFVAEIDGRWIHLTDRCPSCFTGDSDTPDAFCPVHSAATYTRPICLGADPTTCWYPCTRVIDVATACTDHSECCGACCHNE
jgi:hypothetical protein